MSPPSRPVVAIVAGTRPEVVKLAPVLHEARHVAAFEVRWLSTGQHGALEQATLRDLEVTPDLRLAPAPEGAAGLTGATSHLLTAFEGVFSELEPGLVVVQGDTSSAFAAALAAFHARVPVAHVEAGLRSFDPGHPFPEEANRRMIAALAAVHLAHTEGAAQNLLAEGFPRDAVVVTGNPGVDAQRNLGAYQSAARTGRTAVVTLHRRESWQAPLVEMCEAVAELVEGDPELRIVWPVHVQPTVAETVRRRLGGRERIELVAPLAYRDFQALLASADVVLTDSGGIQEEAPEHGLPVLVLREGTERPEAVEHGIATVVGRSRAAIVQAARACLREGAARRPSGPNPFGDGRAAERIVLAIERFLRGERPLLTKSEQFA